MASIVTISAAVDTVICAPDERGEHVFTITNVTGAPIRVGAKVLVEGTAQETWFSILDDGERDLAANSTDQVKVRVQIPAGTDPGLYRFKLLVYSAKHPAEDFTEGPTVALKAPAATVPPATPPKSGFPWWIAVVVIVLLIGGVAGWLLWPTGVAIPDVVGKHRDLAQTFLNDAGLRIGSVDTQESPQQEGIVLSQRPAAGQTVERDTAVDLTLAKPRPAPPPRETPAVPAPIDITALSPRARWASGQLVDAHNTRNNQTLPWMGKDNDNRGFVRLDTIKMENGRNAKALRMHPMWVDNSTIKGWHPWVKLPRANSIYFEAQVGFVAGARHSDGVTFMAWEHHKENGREVWNNILSVAKSYTGQLQTVRADLSHLAGQEVGIELRVDAGRSSGQDWAAWVNPRIVFRN